MRATPCNQGRREFLRVSFISGVGLVVGLALPRSAIGFSSASPVAASNTSSDLAPNAWIRIDKNGTVTVVINHSEMGQGIFTALCHDCCRGIGRGLVQSPHGDGLHGSGLRKSDIRPASHRRQHERAYLLG